MPQRCDATGELASRAVVAAARPRTKCTISLPPVHVCAARLVRPASLACPRPKSTHASLSCPLPPFRRSFASISATAAVSACTASASATQVRAGGGPASVLPAGVTPWEQQQLRRSAGVCWHWHHVPARPPPPPFVQAGTASTAHTAARAPTRPAWGARRRRTPGWHIMCTLRRPLSSRLAPRANGPSSLCEQGWVGGRHRGKV